LGRLYIRSGEELLEIDARPSDSIVLAVGANAPIFVSKSVMEQAQLEQPKPPEQEKPGKGKEKEKQPIPKGSVL
jgi:bifunctional DNase/RNase